MRRLARQEAKEAEAAASERAAERQKALEGTSESVVEDQDEDPGEEQSTDEEGEANTAVGEEAHEEDGNEMSPPPRHETEQGADIELSKANRTVFLGNVSTAAITSKPPRTTLTDHLKSIFATASKPKNGDPKHAVESIASARLLTQMPYRRRPLSQERKSWTRRRSLRTPTQSTPHLI